MHTRLNTGGNKYGFWMAKAQYSASSRFMRCGDLWAVQDKTSESESPTKFHYQKLYSKDIGRTAPSACSFDLGRDQLLLNRAHTSSRLYTLLLAMNEPLSISSTFQTSIPVFNTGSQQVNPVLQKCRAPQIPKVAEGESAAYPN